MADEEKMENMEVLENGKNRRAEPWRNKSVFVLLVLFAIAFVALIVGAVALAKINNILPINDPFITPLPSTPLPSTPLPSNGYNEAGWVQAAQMFLQSIDFSVKPCEVLHYIT